VAALIGFAVGLGVVLLCWLLARRSDRQLHARKMALLREKIERRQQDNEKRPR